MLVGYLYLCLAILLALIVIGLLEDLFRGPDPKFGYNYKNKMFMCLVFLFSCPVINVILAGLYGWARWKARHD